MPKVDMNYQNTIIYKIVCKDLSITDCYVGSTTNFIQRKYYHQITCNNAKRKGYNYNVYSFIRANGGWENWDMIEVEKFPCNDKNEALKQERYWIETLKTNLNSNIPLRTKKEHYEDNRANILAKQKQYSTENRQSILEQRKEHYKNNRDEILKKQKASLNKERVAEYKKQYAEKNAEKIKEYKRQHYLNKKTKQLEEKTQTEEI